MDKVASRAYDSLMNETADTTWNTKRLGPRMEDRDDQDVRYAIIAPARGAVQKILKAAAITEAARRGLEV